jgi:hypothetical protein
VGFGGSANYFKSVTQLQFRAPLFKALVRIFFPFSETTKEQFSSVVTPSSFFFLESVKELSLSLKAGKITALSASGIPVQDRIFIGGPMGSFPLKGFAWNSVGPNDAGEERGCSFSFFFFFPSSM